MTTTNRAFMKAYRTDEPQPAPASPTITGAGPHAPPPHVPPVHASAPSAAFSQRSAIYGPRQQVETPEVRGSHDPPRTVVRGFPDPAHTVMRGSPDPAHSQTEGLPPEQPRTPARNASARPLDRLEPAADGSQQRKDRPQQPGEKRPLSSFIASTGIARLGTERTEADFFRPGNTIASFHWPDVCRQLLRSCDESLSHVADLLVTHAGAGRSLVGILAMTPGDGATTAALCLASRLAEVGRRVIVVDGNFHKPRLAQWLEAETTAGWQDVLKHGAPLTDAVVRATDDRLDLLALGEKIPPDVRRLVSGLQAVVTAGVLRHAYDHVLLDIGAFGDPASQPLQLELMRNMGVDAAIAITRAGRSEPGDFHALADHLRPLGCEFLGLIENRVAMSQAA